MKRMTACVIACLLSIGLCARSASAQKAAETQDSTAAVTETSAQVQLASSKEKDKLKTDVTKLVADAKAGKLKVPGPQFPQPQRNNLSTGAKIGIIAAIAGAIVLIAVVVHVTSDN